MKSAKTPPRKIKYRIYRVDVQYHDYVPRTTRSYVGVTWATSAEKAINNMNTVRASARPTCTATTAATAITDALILRPKRSTHTKRRTI